MSFPRIQMKLSNTDSSEDYEALLDQKLIPLDKFISEDETDVKCEVELERMTDHQSGKIFRAEANLYVGGVMYRAEATEEQMEKAIDVMRDELKRELRRASSKQATLNKQGDQEAKEMMQSGGV